MTMHTNSSGPSDLTRPQHGSTTPPALQGDIAAITLENIFQLCDFAALSGQLDVRTAENSGSFYFSNGVLTYGMLQVNARRIGEILRESAVITEEQLQECLQLHEQGTPHRPLGQILIDKGYVEPTRLDDSLLRQIKEAFFASLAWRQGTFAFYPGLAPVHPAMQLQERVDHLLLEGMVYLDNLTATDER
jgi:hypothetical protein